MQRADAKFERRDPWPMVPFAIEKTVPNVWIVLGSCFLILCIGFLGVA